MMYVSDKSRKILSKKKKRQKEVSDIYMPNVVISHEDDFGSSEDEFAGVDEGVTSRTSKLMPGNAA